MSGGIHEYSYNYKSCQSKNVGSTQLCFWETMSSHHFSVIQVTPNVSVNNVAQVLLDVSWALYYTETELKNSVPSHQVFFYG